MGLGIETAFNEIGGLSKRIYDTQVIDQEQRLTITYDELPEKSWNIRGDGWFGDAHLIRSGSYKFANPTENLPQDTFETDKQFTISNKELFAQVPFTKDFLEKLVGGVTSFEDYTYKVEDMIRTSKKNLNQACYIGPQMIRTTVAVNALAGATSVTLASVQYVHVGMFIDFYSAAGAPLSMNHQITNIVGNVITITPGLANNVVVGDLIYNHDENLNAGTGKGFNSLPAQCDDGTDFPVVFEGLSRTTYPAWRGNRINAGGALLTNDLLQQAQNTIREVGGNDYMTEDYVNFVHLDSVRRYVQIVLPQKRFVDATKYDAGYERPNALEWNGRKIVVDPDCGKRDWIMYNKTNGGKMEISPLKVESTLGGTTMKWRNGFMQGEVLVYFNGNIGTNKCNAHAIIRNLATL